MSVASVNTSAAERISTRLQAEIDEKARIKAETEQILTARQEHQTTIGAMLGAELLSLYSDVDHVNRRKRSLSSLGHLATKFLTRGRVIKEIYREAFFIDLQGNRRRIYSMQGQVNGTSVDLPVDSTMLTADGTFVHNWVVDLTPGLPEVNKDSSGRLSCSIYEATTDPNSGLRERELKYQVNAFEGALGPDSEVLSFAHGAPDDEMIMLSKNSAEHAFALVKQAREVLGV